MNDELRASLPADVVAAIDNQEQAGGRPVLISTTAPELPWVVFRAPRLSDVALYTSQAAPSGVGPLMASVGLARLLVVHPAAPDLQRIVDTKPFLVLRAVQALLKDLGLDARAEKKSLN